MMREGGILLNLLWPKNSDEKLIKMKHMEMLRICEKSMFLLRMSEMCIRIQEEI